MSKLKKKKIIVLSVIICLIIGLCVSTTTTAHHDVESTTTTAHHDEVEPICETIEILKERDFICGFEAQLKLNRKLPPLHPKTSNVKQLLQSIKYQETIANGIARFRQRHMADGQLLVLTSLLLEEVIETYDNILKNMIIRVVRDSVSYSELEAATRFLLMVVNGPGDPNVNFIMNGLPVPFHYKEGRIDFRELFSNEVKRKWKDDSNAVRAVISIVTNRHLDSLNWNQEWYQWAAHELQQTSVAFVFADQYPVVLNFHLGVDSVQDVSSEEELRINFWNLLTCMLGLVD